LFKNVDLGNTPSSDVPMISLIISSTLLNMLFYKILPSSLKPLIKSYIISTIHAIISVIGVLNYFLKYEINFLEINRIIGGGIFGTGDEIMVYSVCYSCGYFIYDFLLMCRDKTVRTSSAIAHHILILLTFLSGLFTRICHPCHFYLLAEELSTIPLNIKSIYRHQPRIHQLCSLLFVFCFIISRVIYGSIICGYAFYAAPEFLRLAWNFDDMFSFFFGLSQAFLCILTRLMNLFWTYLIFRKVFKC
jgi:hypothetical protein